MSTPLSPRSVRPSHRQGVYTHRLHATQKQGVPDYTHDDIIDGLGVAERPVGLLRPLRTARPMHMPPHAPLFRRHTTRRRPIAARCTCSCLSAPSSVRCANTQVRPSGRARSTPRELRGRCVSRSRPQRPSGPRARPELEAGRRGGRGRTRASNGGSIEKPRRGRRCFSCSGAAGVRPIARFPLVSRLEGCRGQSGRAGASPLCGLG